MTLSARTVRNWDAQPWRSCGRCGYWVPGRGLVSWLRWREHRLVHHRILREARK